VIQRGVGRGGDHGRAEDDVWVEVVREQDGDADALSEAGEAVTKGSAKASYSQSCLLHSIQGFAQGHTFRLRAAV
jgi:hypothetical protein